MDKTYESVYPQVQYHACSLYIRFLLSSVVHNLNTIIGYVKDLLMYYRFYQVWCMSAELLYGCQTAGVQIDKWLPNETTTDNTASKVGLTTIDLSCEI